MWKIKNRLLFDWSRKVIMRHGFMEDLVDSEKPKKALNKMKRTDAKEHFRNMDFFF